MQWDKFSWKILRDRVQIEHFAVADGYAEQYMYIHFFISNRFYVYMRTS